MVFSLIYTIILKSCGYFNEIGSEHHQQENIIKKSVWTDCVLGKEL